MTFARFLVEWNGCAETWPGGGPDHCFAQQNGGYGDGFGTASTGGDWTFDDSIIRYNTSDGLDLLYLGVSGQAGRATVRRTVAMGNAGNQLKLAGGAGIVNSLAIGNCAFFEGKPFSQEMTPGDHCRAYGNAVAISPQAGDASSIVNTTVVGQGDCLLELECPQGNCTGNEPIGIYNSIFRGYTDWGQPWEQSCFMYYDSFMAGQVTNDYNVTYTTKDGNLDCATGANNICDTDPLFADSTLATFNGHLKAASPAIDNGLPVGGAGGLVPSDDLDGAFRPYGSGVDRGAYEYHPALANFVVAEGQAPPNPNRVRIYTSGGAATSIDFYAYAAGGYGANVAAGDLEPSSTDEIISGPGPGPVFGPQIRAFQNDSTPIPNVNFYAYGTLRFGVNAGRGGIDLDSFSEILSGAGLGVVFGPHVRAFDVDGGPVKPIPKVSFFAYGTLKYGVNVSSGDVENDGFDELLTGPGPGVIFGPQIRGFNYDGSTVASIGGINFNAFSFTSFGVNLEGGDLEGNGLAGVVCSPGPGSTLPARFRGFSFQGGTHQLTGYDVTPYPSMFGGRPGAGDFNGNGQDELITAAGPDPTAASTIDCFRYSGSALTQLTNAFTPFPANTYGADAASGMLGY